MGGNPWPKPTSGLLVAAAENGMRVPDRRELRKDRCVGGRSGTIANSSGVVHEKIDWQFVEKPTNCNGDALVEPQTGLCPVCTSIRSDHAVIASSAL